MDRARVWPDFDDAWILHRDADIVVVDKPDGVPTQAADPTRPDDLLTRLRRHLGAAYVGTHQRLDKDTSGVLVMTLRREANAKLAAQFEGRDVEKRYLAGVVGWPSGRERATLREPIGGKKAVTQVKVLGRSGDRALLELVLETGRTHQARVHLAGAGAPIAGDALYGGSPAERLMLHAHVLAFAHPGSSTGPRSPRARFVAPRPRAFDDWLAHGDLGARVYDDDDALDRTLARAMRRRFSLGRSDATTAFRVVNEAGDALPGLAVDLYGEHLVAQLYADVPREARLLDRLYALGARGVYLKRRPKQANVIVDARREDLAPHLPVRGEPAPDEFAVLEESVPYLVKLGDGLSTGIFLDQRQNRARVRELASGSSVANLFSYTCAFTVAAAVGGAWRTVSVDAAAAALERGRANMANAGVLDAADHTFVAEDVFRWLARPRTKATLFDLVLLDPPSYSTTKARRFVAEDDYAELAALALGILRPGGRLLACINHRKVRRDKFRRALVAAARTARVEIAQLKDLPDPSDYPSAAGAEAHMKSALLTTKR